MLINESCYYFIQSQVYEFNSLTGYGVEVDEVLYSLFANKPGDNSKGFKILHDWDEGQNNDPFWNTIENEHSVVSFLKKVCQSVREDFEREAKEDMSRFSLIKFIQWVGDGYNFDKPGHAEQIVDDYLKEQSEIKIPKTQPSDRESFKEGIT